MSEFKFTVHKNMPIPNAGNLIKSHLSEEIQMLVNNMKIGDCIDAPSLKLATSVSNLLSRNGNIATDHNYFKAVTRKIRTEDGTLFWRIWKVKK